MKNGATIPYEDILLNTVYTFVHSITEREKTLFAEMTGDISDDLGTVHGMLAASFFSTLIDMHGPGPETVYVSQSLQFRSPINFDAPLTISGVVTAKNDGTRMITLDTQIASSGKIVISGEARLQLPR